LEAHDDAFIKPKTENTGDTVLLTLKLISEPPLLGLLRAGAALGCAPLGLLGQAGVSA
jgi:hypothetical protein